MRLFTNIFNVFILMAFLSGLAMGQGKMVFDVTTYDFGEVKEEDGPVSYTFSFVNTGDKPVKVTGVEASCGCTTPDWTRVEVLPNDTGTITAEYNPYNRPGSFKKSLKVNFTYGSDNQMAILFIAGSVEPQPKSIEDELALKIGATRLKYKSLNIGRVSTEKPVEKVFKVYNDSDSIWSWLPDKSKLPNHIRVEYDPVSLPAKGVGRLILTYDPGVKNDLGFISDDIMLVTNEREVPEKELKVIATIEEYFGFMTAEEMARAPKLKFDRNKHDFGEIRKGSMVDTDFELTNTGQTELEIRKVKTNCGCTVVKLEKKVLAPGESIQMQVSFDSSERRGRQYKTVTVFSNDPGAPTQVLSIKAEID